MATATRAVEREAPLPLANGDHLSRDEFELRYDAMPELKKAELIDGVVYVGSPVGMDSHAEPHADVLVWLGVYRASHPGVKLGDNGSVVLDAETQVQPDAALWRAEGGGARLSGHYLHGPSWWSK